MIGRVFLGLLAALLVRGGGGAAPLAAQPAAPPPTVMDRIVAIVGTTPMLASQVDERILVAFPGGRGLPSDSAELREVRRQLVRRLVDEELIVQAARRDTVIKVIEEDVTQAVDESIRNARSRFPSDEAYRVDLRAAGFETPDEYRSWLTEQQRRAFLQRQFISRVEQDPKFKRVNPTESEIRAYFDKNRSNFGNRPESVAWRQLIVAPKPAEAAKARAKALADSILVELRKGADFAAAARRFSMDPASRDQGGTMGWVRRGIGLDPRFEEMAFLLRPGIVSDPVETGFGFHLIQPERAQPAEVLVRHILIMPDIVQADADSARRTAERIREALLAGASLDSLQAAYHDRLEDRDLPPVPVDSLPQVYRQAFQGLAAGALSGVIRLPAPDPLRSKYGVLRVTSRVPAGEVRFEDVKEWIRSTLSGELTHRRMVDRLERSTFVEIRPG